MSHLRSKLSVARGLGSAKTGTTRFIAERTSALALIPLCLWFAVSLICLLSGESEISLSSWLHSPFNALFFAIFIIFSFWHSKLGMQVIIEDYIHAPTLRNGLFHLSSALHILLGLLCLMAVIQLHFLTEASPI